MENLEMKKFQRTKENFLCEKCGLSVEGSGYTNHCSSCLWSKHVDINPGDRQAKCQGMMEPISVVSKGEEYVILHHCVECGFEKKNKASKDDNFDAIIQISKNPVNRRKGAFNENEL